MPDGPAPAPAPAPAPSTPATSPSAGIAATIGERIAPPGAGRVYRAHRRVRLSDVDTRGVARLDSVARYLQDVATDDVREAGVEDAVAWVVRRTTIVAPTRPRYGERIELATWCSGAGSALAERRTTLEGEGGSLVEAVSLWVSLDRTTLRPGPVADEHFEPYQEQSAGRRVRSRFLLPAGPPGDRDADPHRHPWPLRDSDFDLFSHVNNVVAWMAVEEEACRRHPAARPLWGQVEYRRAIEMGEAPVLVSSVGDDVLGVWLMGEDGTAAISARVGWAAEAAFQT
ncbi:MAG TPA: acyl-ACP thioesterase domain-containing protein [Acidimicrobiales bacterium]|nr:acyl-ACP thioesterase domain-containing protein [Acidimicrobiales bacterium]